MTLTIEHLKRYLGTGLELINELQEVVYLTGIETREFEQDFIYFSKIVYESGDLGNESGNYKRYIECPIYTDFATIENNILYKLLLYPLSSLTEYREDLGFIPYEELAEIEEVVTCRFAPEFFENCQNELPYWIIQKLYEWHIDIHNLIENNLAIDKRTIKNQNGLLHKEKNGLIT